LGQSTIPEVTTN
jgi:hypothetical protein